MAILSGSEVVLPAEYISSEHCDLTQPLKITIAIKHDIHNNGLTLQEYAEAVINGTRSVLTSDEFSQQFSAPTIDINSVTNFVNQYGLTVTKVYPETASMKVIGTVDQFNNAFGITLINVTTSTRTYMSYVGAISIPDNLSNIIIGVLGLDNTLEFIRNSYPGTPSNPPWPQDLARAYNFPSNGGSYQTEGTGTCIGIIELGGGYITQNLTSSFSRIGLPNPTTVDFLIGSGSNNPADPNSVEVMLDIYAASGISPASTQVIYFTDNSEVGFYNGVYAAINDSVNNPNVISISWGIDESLWSGLYRYLMDTVFQQAIVKGITVTVATGDYGSQAYAGRPAYSVQYPGSSPYVLACGGTQITLNGDGTINTEVVWNDGAMSSAGGISNLYLVPTYQTGLRVKTYPSGTTGVIGGRSTPDLSAQATGYQFYYGNSNTFITSGGTSAVAPLYAGLIARIVSLLGRNVGFINTKIYRDTTVFNDITSGNNAAPNSLGYSATTGWDACTGLGSPNGTAIYNLLKAVSRVKTDSGWQTINNMYVKTGNSTWSTVKAVYAKTDSGWQETY